MALSMAPYLAYPAAKAKIGAHATEAGLLTYGIAGGKRRHIKKSRDRKPKPA